MSLYDDAGGVPDRKLFSIGENLPVSAAQSTGIEPPITVPALAGKTYWVAAGCGPSTTGTPFLFQKPVAGQLYYEVTVGSFTDFMPVQLSSFALRPVSGTALSFFVSLLNEP